MINQLKYHKVPLPAVPVPVVVGKSQATLVATSRECQDKNDGKFKKKSRKDINQVRHINFY